MATNVCRGQSPLKDGVRQAAYPSNKMSELFTGIEPEALSRRQEKTGKNNKCFK